MKNGTGAVIRMDSKAMEFLWRRAFLSLQMCVMNLHSAILRKTWTKEKALEYLHEQSGKSF